MSTELATIEHSQTALDIRAQVNRIQEVMKEIMIKGTHYGTVPGCGDKPTLLKAGAEKLMMTFRLAADPEIEDLSDAYTRRYRIKTRVTSQATGQFLGTGVGECASDEEKYAWREAVCQEEYDATDPSLRREKWKRNQKTPTLQVHTNPSDVANTILKMCKKRSLVDAILTVTAASDIFTQDIEEMPEEIRGNGHAAAPKPAAPSNEMCVPNYGPDAGQPFSQVKTEHLHDYLAGAVRSITDPKKANFLKKNEAMYDALKAEIEKREQPHETVQGEGLLGSGTAIPEFLKDKDAPAPHQQPTKTASSEAQETKPRGTRGPKELTASEWQVMITDIDMNPDWATLKHDWKVQNKVENVIRLTAGGQQHFLNYLREKIGKAFPY